MISELHCALAHAAVPIVSLTACADGYGAWIELLIPRVSYGCWVVAFWVAADPNEIRCVLYIDDCPVTTRRRVTLAEVASICQALTQASDTVLLRDLVAPWQS